MEMVNSFPKHSIAGIICLIEITLSLRAHIRSSRNILQIYKSRALRRITSRLVDRLSCRGVFVDFTRKVFLPALSPAGRQLRPRE